MIAPAFRSRFGQPSRRLPIPGENESSTVEWQKAHWIPSVRSPPLSSGNPVTPTTAFAFNRAIVTFGSPRFTCRALSASMIDLGSASTSTLRPTASAVAGLTPAPTPPWALPSIASWIRSVPPQKSSSPKVSNRKT